MEEPYMERTKTEKHKMQKPMMVQKQYEVIIQKNWANLTDHINFEEISPRLIQEGVITVQENIRIRGGPHTSNVHMMPEFLTILVNKLLEKIYYQFKEVLRKCECGLPLDYLEKTELEIENGKICFIHCTINTSSFNHI